MILTAAALVGFSISDAFWQLCLWAVPYGLGAGAVDAALNAFVAVHYKSQHMSWLHCMWGIGASGGPIIMAQCLARSTWSTGFFVLGGIQVAIAVVLTLSLPLWHDRTVPRPAMHAEGCVSEAVMAPEGTAAPETNAVSEVPAHHTRCDLLHRPGVLAVLVSFFCYNAFEATCGNWAATYCTLARGVDAGTAASWAALFYMGITVGRAVSGFISLKVSDHNMIRLGQALIAFALVFVLIPAGNTTLFVGLVLLGCGCAPIYPSTIHATPARFGDDLALELTGMQMAFAYIGTLAMPPLFGVLAQCIGAWLYPWYLVAFLVGMIVSGEHLNRLMRVQKHAG